MLNPPSITRRRAGTVRASNGIRGILADNQVNAIHWLSSEEVLVAGTSGGPWSI